ncbi:YqgE/AlgH family protein [Novosphingobium sp. MW5]|nr:YqgE/AlgH family protein [Novosphingobium sp. MW5]
MTESQFLAGRLLLAMPGMGDPRFDHSVIAMITHDEQGAFGLGIGHLREGISLHEILRELDIDPGAAPDLPVHDGGPVEPSRGFILHSRDWQEEASLDAGPLGLVSASLTLLRAIAEGRGPERWLMALGYAGWGAGQLDNEMRHHGWYAADGHSEVIWETRAAGRWHAAWRAEGIDPALLASQTGTA